MIKTKSGSLNTLITLLKYKHIENIKDGCGKIYTFYT